MSLATKYRPDTFEGIAGSKNKEVAKSLAALVAQPDPPHAYLFHGPSGCGKTTLGRLVATGLGCSEDDFREVDSADFRGIDTIREIRRNSHFKGLRGERRVWLIDECFAAGTRVVTLDGDVCIEALRPGDIVYSLVGPSCVSHVFHNLVYLDRIVRLDLSNGRTIYTTKDHLFRTNERTWRKASDLCVGDLLLSLHRDIVSSTYFVGKDVTTVPAFVPLVQQVLHSEEWQGSTLLFEGVCKQGVCRSKTGDFANSALRRLWKTDGVLAESKVQSDNVWKDLWERISGAEAHRSEAFGRIKAQIIGSPYQDDGPKYRFGSEIEEAAFRPHEDVKSESDVGRSREGQGNEADQGFPACLEGGTWGQRQVNPPADYVGGYSRLADRGSDTDRASAGQGWVSLELQGGYRGYGSEDCDRGGWQGALIRPSKSARSQEGNEARGIRVEGVTFYQRGSNDDDFRRVIGDRERRQGFAIFYDLEVEDDPSYFAEGVAVHNCHKMTNDAQNALLKGLEDPPSHCYYVLATTEPEKLLPTIVSRCVGFSVYPLADDEMLRLLHRTASKEDKPQSRAVLQSIVEASQGRPRFALSSLEKLIADPEAGEAALASVELVKSKSIDLCRVLMNSQGWKAVSHILSELKDEEVESIRRAVMGYCANILLRGENDKAALIMDEFVAPFYDSGYPGLVHACYTVVRGN